MSEKLSITDTEKEVSLDSNKSDAVAIGVKSILGIVPFGSLISEIATTVIPNQRTERIVQFVEILNEKFKYVEKDVVELKTKSEEFTDLLQDGFIQASRALSKKRLEDIASLLKNSLTDKELGHLEKKTLLSLLNELNDAELIWLKNFSFENKFGGTPEYQDFYETHKNLLTPIAPTFGSSQTDLDKQAFQKRYKNKLIQLGLIEENYCSRLGSLLLKFIDAI